MNEHMPSIQGLEMIGPAGTGGMSTVWKAYDSSMKRYVAVKILNSDLAVERSEKSSFAEEAKSMMRLEHPGIVKCFRLGEDAGVLYYVMEFVDGYNFGTLLARKQHLSQDDSLLICESVAAALDYAWNEHGIVHCDIKPENIMINTSGVVKITDLGLSRTFRFLRESVKDIPDHVMGTPAYIAPEQIYGDVELDCRADIYELAATLYHLSTGRLLFPGLNNEDMMRAHCSETQQARDPREYQPSLAEGFCQLLEAMLVKNRDYRVQKWEDVISMCLDVERGVRFKPRSTPGVSSVRLGSGGR